MATLELVRTMAVHYQNSTYSLFPLNDIASRGFIAIALGLAILFYGGSTQVLQLGVVSLLLIGVVTRLSWSLRHKKIYWSWVHTLLALYVVCLIINIYTSVFAENSIQVAWLFLVLPMAVLLCGRTNDEYWQLLLPLLCLPMSFSVFWGFSEFFLGSGRSSGPVVDPNGWASGINLFFFVLAAWFFKSGGRTASTLFLLLGLFAAASFMAYSRVGLLVFAAAFTFVSIVALSMPAYRRRAVMLIVLIATTYYTVQFYRSAEEATKHSEGYTLDMQAVGWSQRLGQWQSGLAQYLDHPVTGSGLGTFKVLYPRYRTLADANTAGNYVHNDYIQLLAEGGPVLILFVVALAGFLLWQMSLALWRLAQTKKQKQSRKDFEIIVLIVALGTVFIHALMNFTFYNLVNQLIMGCVLARVLWLSGLTTEHLLTFRSPALIRIAVIVSATYVLLVNYADAISSDLVYQGGLLPLDRNDHADQMKTYEILSAIRQFRSQNSANRFAMAIFFRTSFDDQPEESTQARQSLAIATALEYQKGLEINPYSYQNQQFFADFLSQNPWLIELDEISSAPEQLLRSGVANAPFQIHRHVVLAEFLEQQGREDDAYQMLKAAIVWWPMRYNEYRVWQTQLHVKLLRMAKRRGDDETIRLLLNVAGPA